MAQQEWADAAASRFRPDGRIGTPFHSRTARDSATPWYFNWDLHHVVDVYDDFYAELRAIRETVAMADMSPLSKCVISGPDATALVDRLITRDVNALSVGSIYYAPLCNEAGKLIVAGLVFRAGESTFRFTSDSIYDWFTQQAEGYDVSLADVTDDFGILTVQGPSSRVVLERATDRDWSDLDFSRLERAEIGDGDVEVARQGFTGEHGYEILTPRAGAPAVWDAVAEAGEDVQIRPCGEWAIDVARVEAGFLITGPDFASAGPDPTGSHTVSATDARYESSPFELGLGKFVDFDKGDFVGKEALLQEQERGGPSRTLMGLDIDWHQVVAEHVDRGIAPNVSRRVDWVAKPVTAGGEVVGRATSVTWAPTVGKLIGFGHLNRDVGNAGTAVSVEWPVAGTGEVAAVAASVSELPFLQLRRT